LSHLGKSHRDRDDDDERHLHARQHRRIAQVGETSDTASSDAWHKLTWVSESDLLISCNGIGGEENHVHRWQARPAEPRCADLKFKVVQESASSLRNGA
jgi:hypothetical protein